MTEPATPTPTPPEFTQGSVKQDPVSQAVAVRTNFPDPYFDHQWGVMTVDRGGHYSSYDEVESWTDLATGAARKDEKEKAAK
jgi:hypothetical protein